MIEAHQNLDPGSCRTDIFGVTVAMAHRTLSAAEVLQTVPGNFYLGQFNSSVRCLRSLVSCRAVVMCTELVVHISEEGPLGLVSESGHFFIH